MIVVPPTITAVSPWNRYGSPSVWSAPEKPASSTPTIAEQTALAANTTVHTRLVLTRARSAARGLAPVAYRRRPAVVRCRTTPARIATTAQITTTGLTASPKVVPLAEVRLDRKAG